MSKPQSPVLTEHRQSSVSNASRISEIPVSSMDASVADFLTAKIEQLKDETSHIAAIKEELDELDYGSTTTNAEYRQELVPFITRLRSMNSTLRVLKRQRHGLAEDMNEEVETQRRQKQHLLSDEALLESIYEDSIIARVREAEEKQKASSLDRSKFKQDVRDYYSTSSWTGISTWCHVLGSIVPNECAKASHILPNGLDREELGHLFGDTDSVTSLPQNGLSLCHRVKSLFDTGDIAIVPMPGPMTIPTRWRCVVLNESLNDEPVYAFPCMREEVPVWIRVKNLDNRELKFLSDKRPRRQYLYLRFLIAYIWSKRRKVPHLDEKVESRKFWPSASSYLRRSTLQTLARAISGCEIPKDLVASQTFESSDDPVRDFVAGMVLAADLRDIQPPDIQDHEDLMDALAQTMKQL